MALNQSQVSSWTDIDKGLYDMIFEICAALSNLEIKFHPLRLHANHTLVCCATGFMGLVKKWYASGEGSERGGGSALISSFEVCTTQIAMNPLGFSVNL